MEFPLLKIDQASVQRTGTKILRDLSLEIPEGQHTVILGPNGCGKSTLIKLIARQIYPLAHPDGRAVISIFGKSLWNVFELRTLLGIVSPELQFAFTTASEINGLDAVISGFFASQGVAKNHTVTEEMRKKSIEALEKLGASGLAEKSMSIMSAGEARRVLIARALVHEPRALLLDEPTAGLDIAARRHFLDTLRTLAAAGKTLLLVTHHVDEIIPEIDHVILMKNGTVYADGKKTAVLTSENLSSVFESGVDVRSSGPGYFSADLSGF